MYKLRNGKFAVNVPFDAINALQIKDGDEVDFFKHPEGFFIFSKKSEIVAALTQKPQQTIQRTEQGGSESGIMVDAEELGLLKKLDEFKYTDRTKDKVNAKLNDDERQVLQKLIKKKLVVPYRKPGEQDYHYSIPNDIYKKFLFRMRGITPAKELEMLKWQKPAPQPEPVKEKEPKTWEKRFASNDSNISLLETNGFIVLPTEAEASNLSIALEDSIRHGLVIGTRAFNKKFYVALKGFIEKNTVKIIKTLGHKSMNVSEISKITGIPEDGIRSILYILLESGDITELKKDVFRVIE